MTNVTGIKAKLTAVGACALGAVALAAGPASAAEWEVDYAGSASGGSSWECVYDSSRADACFGDVGEWFAIRDKASNNLPVAIQWEFYLWGIPERQGVIYSTAGVSAGWQYKNKSFPESADTNGDTFVKFRACEAQGSGDTRTLVSCSSWKYSTT
ncbi:hypothetical protein [Streptomyces sp. NPDC053542]|uniref:hypothetical protein n=1 Tax=Streptomyces sp. NPDC053542 TaxID=3365710 RepID=UPI0037D1E480